MNSRGARAVRGVIAASVSTLIAAFSHSAGGGTFPSPSILALVFSFTALVCIALTGRALSTGRVALSVFVSQAVFHLTFSLPVGDPAVGPALGIHDHHVVGVIPSSHPMHSMASHLTGGMVFSHLIAAVITTTALIWGERAFWSLFETARFALSLLITWAVSVVDAPHVVANPLNRWIAAPLSVVVLCGIRLRGPPRFSAFST